MSEELSLRLRYLASELKEGFDIRVIPVGVKLKFCIMVFRGSGAMVCVPGSISETIDGAIDAAIERWKSRNQEYPFV